MAAGHHSHSDSSGHHHHHLKGRKLLIAILLNIVITVSQVIGGLVSGSLSLLSDALHNFSDVLSLIVSYVANRLVGKKASAHKTFGYKRAEILAAFINASALMIVAFILIKEAIERFFNPQFVSSDIVIWLSILGIAANGFSVLLLKSDASSNMNLKSAYLHLLTDMMASVAVLIGGLLMKFFEWFWVDPLLTLLIAFYLIIMGYGLLKESTKVLMLFTPQSVDVDKVAEIIADFDVIDNIHHVHIWSLNEDEIHLEAHVEFNKDINLSEFGGILISIEKVLLEEFKINHVNIQPEFGRTDSKSIIVQD